MMHRQSPVTSPVITVNVDDIDEALTKLERLDGKTISGREAVADMGFSAYFQDPEETSWASGRWPRRADGPLSTVEAIGVGEAREIGLLPGLGVPPIAHISTRGSDHS